MTDQVRHHACEQCGEAYTGRSVARFCSDRCRGKAWQTRRRQAAAFAREHGLIK